MGETLTNIGDLHILLKLIREWQHYHLQKYELFLQENLVVKTIAMAKKFFTMAKHFQDDEKVVNLFTTWLKTGDGSRFSKMHIEIASIAQIGEPRSFGCYPSLL
jgi:hypothetical protein